MDRVVGRHAAVSLTIGVIGIGRWGPNLLRNFHNHRTSVVAMVAERDGRRRAQIAELYPDVRVVPEADLVIEASEIDAVAIATPTRTHYPLVRQALLAGKHVLVEKPLTDDLATAVELQKLADERRRVLLVGHVFIYNPGVETVKRYLGRGDLGKPYYISMVRTNLGPIRTDVNASWDLASHDISIANYWLDAHPVSASATGGSWINAGIADAVFATLEYPNDVLVSLEVSWLNPRKVRDITVVAKDKMLTLDDTNDQEPIRIYDKGVVDDRVRDEVIDTHGEFRSMVHEGEIVIPRVSLGEPLKSECDHFLECVLHDVAPRTGPRPAVDVVRALDAIDRSMRLAGASVSILA
jgi:predicted dehydrogenase